MVSTYFYINYNVTYKCDFPLQHSRRPGGTTQSAADCQICRPGFESWQGSIYVVSSCGIVIKYKCEVQVLLISMKSHCEVI